MADFVRLPLQRWRGGSALPAWYSCLATGFVVFSLRSSTAACLAEASTTCGTSRSALTVLPLFWPTRWPLLDCHALLQGCPLSPLCLNAMMVVWIKTVQREDTGVKLATFIDDRMLWLRKRRGAARAIHRAMAAGAVADQALGFTLHPAKLESFGTTQKVRDFLHEFSDTVGVPQFTFKLLGIPYNTSRAAPVATEGIAPDLQARCKRIQLCGTSRGLRCALLRKLLVSLFRWAAPWLRFSKQLLPVA